MTGALFLLVLVLLGVVGVMGARVLLARRAEERARRDVALTEALPALPGGALVAVRSDQGRRVLTWTRAVSSAQQLTIEPVMRVNGLSALDMDESRATMDVAEVRLSGTMREILSVQDAQLQLDRVELLCLHRAPLTSLTFRDGQLTAQVDITQLDPEQSAEAHQHLHTVLARLEELAIMLGHVRGGTAQLEQIAQSARAEVVARQALLGIVTTWAGTEAAAHAWASLGGRSEEDIAALLRRVPEQTLDHLEGKKLHQALAEGLATQAFDSAWMLAYISRRFGAIEFVRNARSPLREELFAAMAQRGLTREESRLWSLTFSDARSFEEQLNLLLGLQHLDLSASEEGVPGAFGELLVVRAGDAARAQARELTAQLVAQFARGVGGALLDEPCLRHLTTRIEDNTEAVRLAWIDAAGATGDAGTLHTLERMATSGEPNGKVLRALREACDEISARLAAQPHSGGLSLAREQMDASGAISQVRGGLLGLYTPEQTP